MRVDRSRQLTDARREERAEPIVTYTRIEEAEDRTEPRLGGAARDHFQDDLTALPHIDAPRAHVAVDIDIDDIAEPVEEPRGRRKVRRKRSFAGRLLVLTGLLAVLGGVGVLAATFTGIVNSGPSATANVEAAAPAVVHVADETPAIDPATLADSSTVRVIGGSPNAPTAAAPAADTTVAALAPSASTEAPSAARVMIDPPLPRLRPITASYNPPQTGPAATVAPMPAVVAPMTDPNGIVMPAPAPAAQAGAAPVNDLDSALASVDRILGSQPPAPAQSGVAGTLPLPVLEPLPRSAADPYGANTVVYPAAPPQANAYPVYPATNGQVYGPFLPEEEVAVNQQGSRFLPRRDVFIVPNAPVPPADIPNAGTIWGQ